MANQPLRTNSCHQIHVIMIRRSGILATISAGLLIGLCSSSQGQGTPTSDPVLQAWKGNADVVSCNQCHYQAPQGGLTDDSDTTFSRQNELQFWLAHDKHAIARRRVQPLTQDEIEDEAKRLIEELAPLGNQVNLRETVTGWLGASNVLSRRICDKLGYDVSADSQDTRFRDNCLSCHGGYRHDVATDAANFANNQPGISCNYCHQIGSDARWAGVHGLRTRRDQWRVGRPDQKEKLGMRDLVTTSKRASLCFDCHIGNRQQNQFVSHDMYAAGHPPLPSVELHTFSEQMPRKGKTPQMGHWRSGGELSKLLKGAEKAKFFGTNYAGVKSPDETLWDTRTILVGALAAREKTLDLLVDSAAMNKWGDYSLYDCGACHHELKSDSRRQKRGYPAAPGRPRQPEWANLQLMHIGAFLVDDEKAIMELEGSLSAAFGAAPFGDKDQVAAEASKLRARIQDAIKAAESSVVDVNVANGVLRGLARTPADRLISYDEARQVVWAMRAISAEMKSRNLPLNPKVEQLINDLNQPDVGPGKTGLATQLPAGRREFIYKKGLEADFQRRAAYDPDLLEARLREINDALGPVGANVGRSDKTLTATKP